MPAHTKMPYLATLLTCSPKGSAGKEGGPSIRPYFAWTIAMTIIGTAMTNPKKERKKISTRQAFPRRGGKSAEPSSSAPEAPQHDKPLRPSPRDQNAKPACRERVCTYV